MNMRPSLKITILFTSHPDLFDVTLDVDQFKSYVVALIIIGNGFRAIYTQMGYDNVSANKGFTPIEDKTIIREIFIKLIQYKNAC